MDEEKIRILGQKIRALAEEYDVVISAAVGASDRSMEMHAFPGRFGVDLSSPDQGYFLTHVPIASCSDECRDGFRDLMTRLMNLHPMVGTMQTRLVATFHRLEAAQHFGSKLTDKSLRAIINATTPSTIKH